MGQHLTHLAILAAGLLLAATPPASSQTGDSWTNIGPVGIGGWIHALAVDPKNSATVYVGYNFQGLWKTTNGGTTWSQTGLGLNNWNFVALAVAPSDPSALYAATAGGVGRSSDSGATWHETGAISPVLGQAFYLTAIAVDPLTSTTAYASGIQGCVLFHCSGTLVKTTDGGVSWVPTNSVNIFDSLVALPWSPQTVLGVVGHSGFPQFLMESTDGGSNWAAAAAPPAAYKTTSVAVSPGPPQTIYVGTSDGEIHRSNDGGATWQQAAAGGLSRVNIDALTADALSPSTVYAAAAGKVLRSIDGGDSWGVVSNTPGLTVLASSAMAHGSIWAATDGNGLFRSDLTGQSWALVSPNVPIPNLAVRQIAVDPKAPSTMYVLATNGLYKTLDGGQVWTPLLLSTDLWSLAIDPSHTNTTYCGTGSGVVLKSTDGGVTWQPTVSGLPSNTWVTALGVDPWSPSTVYLGSAGRGAFRSTNAGASWSPVPGIFSAGDGYFFTATSFAFDPVNSAIIYASSNGGSWRSVDTGATWTQIGLNLPDSHAADHLGSIAVEPSSPATLWGANSATYDGAISVWKSADGGDSWSTASAGVQGLNVQALAIDPATPSRAFLGSNTGVFRTEDGGATWSPLSNGLTNPLVSALAVAPGSPSILYAGTTGSSVFQLAISNTPSTCFNDSATLCLGGNRFRVQATFKSSQGSPSAAAQTYFISSTTGAFWFYSSDNLELVIKVLDGTQVNGKWWVFYGALSNVEYTITVTDTQTGAVRTYFNPQGNLASVADTGAF